MKKLFKKLFLTLFTTCLILSSCSAHHNGKAKIEDIVGVYQLTECNEKDEEGNETNLIEKEQIKCFLLINGSNFGYAYYKDINTPERLESVYVEYEKNEEASNNWVEKYASISYFWGENYKHSSGYHPGFNEPALGIWEKSHTLSYSQLSSNVFNNKRNHISVTYRRISNKITFEEFKNKANISLEMPSNFLIKNNKGKIFAGYQDQIQQYFPQFKNIKLIPNDDFTKYKISTLSTELEDNPQNYLTGEELEITGYRNVTSQDSYSDLFFEFQIKGNTIFGQEPTFLFRTQKENSSIAELIYKINDSQLSFWGTI